jgi:hypothetical protein
MENTDTSFSHNLPRGLVYPLPEVRAAVLGISFDFFSAHDEDSNI